MTRVSDVFQTKRGDLKGFHYRGGWIDIERDGKFVHKADRSDGDYDGFAWDGCTPKLHLGPLMFGTWDGPFLKRPGFDVPRAVRAAKFHDAMYQELTELERIDFKRKHVDLLFQEMLHDADFIYANFYYWAVRRFGGWDYRRWLAHEKA